ncbi:MAG: hypothetical protein ACRC9O_09655 [Plesiomonas sp.]|uniref:hypothetical protein n=1 Tax=Plesiomonas sp. TaxID=2486279 RepID=UPI003F30D17A
MITVKGVLKYGIEHNGTLHHSFEIAMLSMAQTCDVIDMTENRYGSLEGRQADIFYQSAGFALGLVQLGSMDKADITAELLFEQLSPEDTAILNNALDDVKKKRSMPKSVEQDCDLLSSHSDVTE